MRHNAVHKILLPTLELVPWNFLSHLYEPPGILIQW